LYSNYCIAFKLFQVPYCKLKLYFQGVSNKPNIVSVIKRRNHLGYDVYFISSVTLELYTVHVLELKPIVVTIQWALVRTYWIDEPLD